MSAIINANQAPSFRAQLVRENLERAKAQSNKHSPQTGGQKELATAHIVARQLRNDFIKKGDDSDTIGTKLSYLVGILQNTTIFPETLLQEQENEVVQIEEKLKALEEQIEEKKKDKTGLKELAEVIKENLEFLQKESEEYLQTTRRKNNLLNQIKEKEAILLEVSDEERIEFEKVTELANESARFLESVDLLDLEESPTTTTELPKPIKLTVYENTQHKPKPADSFKIRATLIARGFETSVKESELFEAQKMFPDLFRQYSDWKHLEVKK